MGTGRPVPAARHPPGPRGLVRTDAPCQQAGPRRSARPHRDPRSAAARQSDSASTSVPKGMVTTGAPAETRYAPPGTSWSRQARIAARKRRRARFRATAPPTRRPTAYATWGGPVEPTARNRTATGPRRQRRARARSWNVAWSRMRQIRPSAGPGPADAGPGPRLGRRASASEPGIRASSSACGCSAGRSASRTASSRGTRSISPPGRVARSGHAVNGQARDSRGAHPALQRGLPRPPGGCLPGLFRGLPGGCGRRHFRPRS